LPGTGSKRHTGGGESILFSYLQIAIKYQYIYIYIYTVYICLIYNHEALSYTISPIANSDLVLWKTNISIYFIKF